MEQRADTEHTSTTRDLRVLHSTVIHGLVVFHAGCLPARLLPLERLETLLGQANLARILGLTRPTFLARRPGLQFSGATLARLEALDRVVDGLESVLSPARIQAWFQRASPDLKGVR